jgi:hypothetical protein
LISIVISRVKYSELLIGQHGIQEYEGAGSATNNTIGTRDSVVPVSRLVYLLIVSTLTQRATGQNRTHEFTMLEFVFDETLTQASFLKSYCLRTIAGAPAATE